MRCSHRGSHAWQEEPSSGDDHRNVPFPELSIPTATRYLSRPDITIVSKFQPNRSGIPRAKRDPDKVNLERSRRLCATDMNERRSSKRSTAESERTARPFDSQRTLNAAAPYRFETPGTSYATEMRNADDDRSSKIGKFGRARLANPAPTTRHGARGDARTRRPFREVVRSMFGDLQ